MAAIVGCGDVSVVHAEALAAVGNVDLVAVCDTHPGRLAAATQRWGVPGFTSHEQLYAAVHPDVVHVATPRAAHEDPTVDALAAGIHVLQEKPLAATLAQGERIFAAAAGAAERGTKVGTCFQNRYNTSSQTLHQLLTSGALGAVQGCYATVVWAGTADYYRSRPWRGSWVGSGGGLLINQAIHTLDLVAWLRGGVSAVAGHASTRAWVRSSRWRTPQRRC